MSNYENKDVIGLHTKKGVKRKTIQPGPSQFAVESYERERSINNAVFNSRKLKKKIGSQYRPTFPFIKAHRFEYVEMNKRVKDQFHISNRSAMRLRSSSNEIPISGLAINSSRLRVASATPSSSSRKNSGSERRSLDASVARSVTESWKASSSTFAIVSMPTSIHQYFAGVLRASFSRPPVTRAVAATDSAAFPNPIPSPRHECR